jgi:hypothetical protein
MSTTLRFPQVVVAVLAAAVAVGPARAAEDNLLRGPHPFRKANELSVHMLLASGGDNTPSGGKLALDYGYKLYGPAWLNLQLNSQRATCSSPSGGNCTSASGQVYETLAGIKLKWSTAIPIVPYAKAGVGLAYAFPDRAANGWGVAARVGGGANYFFFDWLGLGLELAFSTGHLSTASPSYSVFDVGGGLELQF